MTDDLLDRLEAAAPTLDQVIFDRPAGPVRSPHRRRAVVLAAAVLVTVTGGIVALAATIGDGAGDTAPAQVATAPPHDAPADSGPPVSVFDVPRPEQVAVLDEALGAGPPALQDPLDAWLYPDSSVALFVRYDDSGGPVAALLVADWSAHEWEKSFGDGRSVDLDGVPARVMADATRPTVGWRYDRGVRAVVGTGAIDEAEVIAAATALAAGDESPPPGFTSHPRPASTWSVVYPNGVNVVIRTAAPGERLDARTSAFVQYGNASPTSDAQTWTAESVYQGQVWGHAGFVDLDESTQVSVHAQADTPFDVNSALASIGIVDADTIPVLWSLGGRHTDAELVDGGVSVAGRWLLSEWQQPDGTRCLDLLIAEGQIVTGCPGWLGPCIFGDSFEMERTWRWTVLVPGAAASVVVVVDGQPTPADVRWPAGDYTVASGSRPYFGDIIDYAERLDVVVDGRSCADLPTT